jgi:hypothetical protein
MPDHALHCVQVGRPSYDILSGEPPDLIEDRETDISLAEGYGAGSEAALKGVGGGWARPLRAGPVYFLHFWACQSVGCLGYSYVEFLAMEIFL